MALQNNYKFLTIIASDKNSSFKNKVKKYILDIGYRKERTANLKLLIDVDFSYNLYYVDHT